MSINDFANAAEDGAKLYTEAFETVQKLMALDINAALKSYRGILETTQLQSRYCDIVTPLAIDTYKKFLMHENMQSCFALGCLMSYASHHYEERAAVLGAAIDSLPEYAKRAIHYNAHTYSNAAMMLVERAGMLQDRKLLKKSFDMIFKTLGMLRPDAESSAHMAVFRAYGIASMHHAVSDYLKAADKALPQVTKKNPFYKAMIEEAIAFASDRATHTPGRPLDTI